MKHVRSTVGTVWHYVKLTVVSVAYAVAGGDES